MVIIWADQILRVISKTTSVQQETSSFIVLIDAYVFGVEKMPTGVLTFLCDITCFDDFSFVLSRYTLRYNFVFFVWHFFMFFMMGLIKLELMLDLFLGIHFTLV
jgi:hypothetical protein